MVPVDMPVTMPSDDTVAFVLLVLQIPPGTVLVKVIEELTDIDEGPEILPATGVAVTVTDRVATDVPQLFVAV